MKRWHQEKARMLRRYRQELASHANEHNRHARRMPWMSLAPLGTATNISCHCARGIGTMRKHRPLVCERTRCSCKAWRGLDLTMLERRDRQEQLLSRLELQAVQEEARDAHELP